MSNKRWIWISCKRTDISVNIMACACAHWLACVLNHVWHFATPWTVACQASLPMEFSRQNTGVGCHFLLQGNLLIQGLNPSLCISCIGSWILHHCAAWEWQLLLYLMLTLLHAKQPDSQWVFLFSCGLETRNILQVGTLFFSLKKEFYKYSIINNKSRLWGG